MEYYIIIFKNTFDAMAAEEKLKSMNIEHKVMPTPTLTILSCGLCIKIDNETIINDIIQKELVQYKSILKKENGEFKNIK